MTYLVTVSNLGTVYFGSNGKRAKEIYQEYVSLSKRNEGRASSKNVTLMAGSRIISEYSPKSADV